MKHNIFGLALLTLLAAVAPSAEQGTGAPPQPADPTGQPGVTFRAEINYVEVDARVVDAQGTFVSTLAQGDFQVLEDGKPQQITVFSLVNLPVERAVRPLFANQPIEPDVQTNASGFNGRVYLIVLDDMHTAPLRSARVKAAAKQFIQRYLGANDVAAIVHTSGRTDGAQEFTSNPRLLVNAVDKFMGRKLRSAILQRIEEESRTRGIRDANERINDPDAAERGNNARNTLDSLKGFADLLAGVRGRRKALVYFSEGIDYDINDVFNNRDATTVMDASRDAIAAATRANVSIYGIDVRGLGAGLDDGIEIQSFPEDTTLGLDSSALQQRNAARAGRAASPLGRNRRVCHRQQQRHRRRVQAGRGRKQLVLRARLLPGQRSARWSLPQDRGSGQPARPDDSGASRLRGAARSGDGAQASRTERRVYGAPRRDDQPDSRRRAAARRDRERVQGTGPQGLGRDLHARGRPRPAAEREGRPLPQRSRDRDRRVRREGEAVSGRSQHRSTSR